MINPCAKELPIYREGESLLPLPRSLLRPHGMNHSLPTSRSQRRQSGQYRSQHSRRTGSHFEGHSALRTSNNITDVFLAKMYGEGHQAHQQKLQFAETPNKKAAHVKSTLAPAATICCTYSFTTSQFHRSIMTTTNQMAMTQSRKRSSRIGRFLVHHGLQQLLGRLLLKRKMVSRT